ncbi:peptide ABC transporter permease [Thermococcus celericrescens]|uniref:Peptide ABC transporter permease n=1 Tax=Thermococcus celericrescens TaxID=227598 RepID=A0A117IT39_9EURY|nr:ABC transporter permease [Thermococcus celericrescens]KUH32716.1 peptide ABC transporter permease [Thermococcus celericrescens]
MRLPIRTLARLVAVYLGVLLVIVLVAGASSNKIAWEYTHEAVLHIRESNPALYAELERNATREGLTVDEYYHRILTKAKGVRTDNLLLMGIDLLRKSFDYYRENPKYDFAHVIKVTLAVMGLAMVLTLLLGLFLGFRLANGRFLGTVEGLARFFNGLPSWWIGAVLIAVFAVELGVFPIAGLRSTPPKEGFEGFLDVLWHLVLPVSTLVFVYVWEFVVTVAHEVRNELGKPYVLTERAKGLPEGLIYRKHVLRNVSIVLSSFTVQKFVEMFTDYIVIDVLFGLGGLGTLLRASFVRTIVPAIGVVVRFDYRLFFVVTLSIATITFLFSLLLELTKGLLDPRVS